MCVSRLESLREIEYVCVSVFVCVPVLFVHTPEMLSNTAVCVCMCVHRTQPARSVTGLSLRPTTVGQWASSSCTTSLTRSPSGLCRTGEYYPLSQASTELCCVYDFPLPSPPRRNIPA